MLDKLRQGWREPNLLTFMFLPISWVYLGLVKVRQIFYRLGIFKSVTLSVPVIVVGNITVGGSGKTPLVMAMVSFLKDKGYRPGVISRGYGGTSQFWPREVDTTTSAEIVGDEPQLIYERCSVAIVVGPDRVRCGCYLIDKLGCDILVSDDGFQHFALNRNIDIVVVDQEFGYGNGLCLPAGPLRESKSALKRANLVALNTNSNDKNQDEAQGYNMRLELQDARNLADGSTKKLSEFRNQQAHAVTGLGNPARFFSELDKLEIKIKRHEFPDHHAFNDSDLAFSDASPILMTEKDGIKCHDMSNAKNIWVIPSELSIDQGLFREVEKILRVS